MPSSPSSSDAMIVPLDTPIVPAPARQTAKRSPAPPWALKRALDWARRRLRLAAARLLHPRARFGTGCDIRPGLELRMGRDATVNFDHRCVLDKQMTIEVH